MNYNWTKTGKRTHSLSLFGTTSLKQSLLSCLLNIGQKMNATSHQSIIISFSVGVTNICYTIQVMKTSLLEERPSFNIRMMALTARPSNTFKVHPCIPPSSLWKLMVHLQGEKNTFLFLFFTCFFLTHHLNIEKISTKTYHRNASLSHRQLTGLQNKILLEFEML